MLEHSQAHHLVECGALQRNISHVRLKEEQALGRPVVAGIRFYSG
jgi:hypothetical protein